MKALETERLFLHGWQRKDLDDLFDIMKSPSVIIGGWEPHSNKDTSVEVLNEYLESDERWAIELKNIGKVIGCIGVCPDNNRGKYSAKMINYVLSETYQGNGFMTEAVTRIVEYLFDELKIDLLSAFHYPDNDKSKKVLEKCGFEYETTIKQGCTRYDGQVFDSVCYSILKSDYLSKIKNK